MRALRALAAALLLFPASSALLAQPAQDVPPGQGAAFAEALKLRAANDHEAALAAFTALRAAAPESFTINYEYGRLLAQMKRYREAADALDIAIRLKDRVDTFELMVYNTRGFVLLMLNQHERALDHFLMEMASPRFGSLTPASRMKVHNNAGLAYLQLDRYVEAQKQFEIARSLGSSLARKNLEIIGSILETLRVANEDVPGVFAPAVGSARSAAQANERIAAVAAKLSVPREAFRLFKQQNNIYQITQGANLSYRKAERLVKEARARGIDDAFVASTSEWADESATLASK